MKIKQHLVITDTDKFSRGDYDVCFTIFGYKPSVEGWIYCGEIEIDVDVDRQKCINLTLAAVEREEKQLKEEFDAKMHLLDQKKSELLCLTCDD